MRMIEPPAPSFTVCSVASDCSPEVRPRRGVLSQAAADGTGSRFSLATSSFTSIIKIRGVNPFILVSASRANTIKPGWRKPLPVLARINGKPAKAWRINMMPVGDGSYYLYLHGDVRKASGTVVGD